MPGVVDCITLCRRKRKVIINRIRITKVNQFRFLLKQIRTTLEDIWIIGQHLFMVYAK